MALGVDYNIFLSARIREEARHLGTRQGTLRGLAVTGGVITAAGIVLAGTFGDLARLPSVPVAEVGIAVAVGVLLDTLVVRTVLVPAALLTIGDRVWWPARPAAPGRGKTATSLILCRRRHQLRAGNWITLSGTRPRELTGCFQDPMIGPQRSSGCTSMYGNVQFGYDVDDRL